MGKRKQQKKKKVQQVKVIDLADPPQVNTHPWYRMTIFFNNSDVTNDYSYSWNSLNSYMQEMYGVGTHTFEFRIISVRAWGPVARGASQSNSSDLGLECYSIIDLQSTTTNQNEPLYIKLDYAGVNKRSFLQYTYPKAHRQTVLSSENGFGSNSFAFVNGCELVYINVLWRFHRTASTIRSRMLSRLAKCDLDDETSSCSFSADD